MVKHLFKVAGVVITIIGLITLPDDIQAWGNRIGEVITAVKANPLSALAVFVGIMLLMVGYWDKIRRLFRGSKRWRTDQDLGNELHGWLRKSHFQLQDVPTPDTAFCFVAKEPLSNRPITVVKINREPGVRLQSRVALNDDQKQMLAAMSLEQKRSVLGDVAIELARINVGFGAQDLANTGVVVTSGFIPSESLTPFQFGERVNQISRAILLIQVVLSRYFPLSDTKATQPILPSIPDKASSPQQGVS